MKEQPPFSVLLAAAILIVSGGWAAVETVFFFLDGRFHVNLELVGIFLGRGLLKGRESSRRWTLFLFGLALLAYVTVFILGVSSGYFQLEENQSHAADVFRFAAAAIVFFGLRTPAAMGWTGKTNELRDVHSGWAVSLTLAGLLLAIPPNLDQHEKKEALKNVYPIYTHINFKNEANEWWKGGVGYQKDMREFGQRDGDPMAPKLELSSYPDDGGGLKYVAFGMASRPVTMSFTAEGCQPAVYTFSNGSPHSVTLILKTAK